MELYDAIIHINHTIEMQPGDKLVRCRIYSTANPAIVFPPGTINITTDYLLERDNSEG